jgi:antitoxin component of RelBE/YafQ-DinJ toxin-antitoxin module
MAKKNFLLRIDEAVLRELHDLAEARGVTMADLIRGIIMDYLSGSTAPQKPDPPKNIQEKQWWM